MLLVLDLTAIVDGQINHERYVAVAKNIGTTARSPVVKNIERLEKEALPFIGKSMTNPATQRSPSSSLSRKTSLTV